MTNYFVGLFARNVLVLFALQAGVSEGFRSMTGPSTGSIGFKVRSNGIFSPYGLIETPSLLKDGTVLLQSTVPINNYPPEVDPIRIPKTLIRWCAARIQKIDEVTRWRAVFITFLSTVLLNRSALDVKLVELWKYLMTSSALPARLFRSDSWEWSLAVVAFVVFIHAFGNADNAVKQATDKGLVHPWRKYRLQDRFEADKLRRNLQSKSETVPETDIEIPPTKQSQWHWNGWYRESLIYIAPLLTWDILAPRRHRRLAPFGAPTTVTIISHITMALLIYDFFFFIGHFLMHKVPFIYKHVHKRHHISQESRACEAVRLSIPEEVYDVLCSIVGINLMGAHPVARSIYNCVIVFLLCELHW